MRGPKRPGDVDDPVADSIRREQQADAMPTAEEAKADHRNFLASEGCRECGEDDPDELGTYMPETHDCSARQQPPAGQVEMVVYCEDCAETRPSYRERTAAKLEADDRLGILFACGAFEYVDDADPSEADGPWRGPVYQRYGPLECDCGAEIHSTE